jgi:hypothetical protein
MKGGRPTDFTPDLGDLICSLIGEGQSLRKICALPDMPVISSIMLWVAKGSRGMEPYVTFSEQYRDSQVRRTEYWAEEIVDIADNDSDDCLFTEDGKMAQNTEFIQRSKLRIHARQWLMGKLNPKYREKQMVESINTNMHIELPITEMDKDILKRLGWSGE